MVSLCVGSCILPSEVKVDTVKEVGSGLFNALAQGVAHSDFVEEINNRHEVLTLVNFLLDTKSYEGVSVKHVDNFRICDVDFVESSDYHARRESSHRRKRSLKLFKKHREYKLRARFILRPINSVREAIFNDVFERDSYLLSELVTVDLEEHVFDCVDHIGH